MNKNGFTLIELLITIAIIGILAGVATTAYIGTIKKAARQDGYLNLETLALLEKKFLDENADYTADLGSAGKTRAICNTNLDLIQTSMPDFRPGRNTTNFCYRILQNQRISAANIPFDPAADTTGSTPCFVATATGIENSRVDGDIFAIDCNNTKTY